MITDAMRTLIEENTLGFVATVSPDGRPNLSPKGSMIVLDDQTIAFADIRSPVTVKNIGSNPAVEINFADIFRRKGCRVKGTATYAPRGTHRFDELMPSFSHWQPLQSRMRGFVIVRITEAKMIVSPIYETATDEAALKKQWLAYYQSLMSRSEN